MTTHLKCSNESTFDQISTLQLPTLPAGTPFLLKSLTNENIEFDELASIVENAVPARVRAKKKHPATKTFQAIRIAINGELEQLEALLAQSVDVLNKGGRLCVISFHSLEDRMVKRFMRSASSEPEQYRGMPTMPDELRPKMKTVGKLIVATDDEIDGNRRSRSARLRIAERT